MTANGIDQPVGDTEPMDTYDANDPPLDQLKAINEELLSVARGLKNGKRGQEKETLELAIDRLMTCRRILWGVDS